MKRADGSAQAKPLLPDRSIVESAWTHDGKSLLFRTTANPGAVGAGDIYVVRASADTTPTPLLNSKYTEAEPALSPDGRWLAYISDESGRPEVYVVPFPNAGAARWNVSTRGGTEPQWSHRGNELFYRDGAGNMVSVEVRTTPSFALGASKVLFPASGYAAYAGHQQYSVSRDDKRFLMVRPFGPEQSPKLVLVKNWAAELKGKGAAR
jgi:dipeptidyl aminopeptidase/acylaminoacyl peptidase